jgi:hypothetical protein
MRENGVLVVPNGLECVTLTVGTSPVPLPARALAPHMYRRAVVQTDQPIRWTAAPDPPTSTFGLVLEDGQTLVYDGNLDTLKFIRAASATGDATLMIHYFGL